MGLNYPALTILSPTTKAKTRSPAQFRFAENEIYKILEVQFLLQNQVSKSVIEFGSRIQGPNFGTPLELFCKSGRMEDLIL